MRRHLTKLSLFALVLGVGCAGDPGDETDGTGADAEETAATSDALAINGTYDPVTPPVQMTTLAQGTGWSKVAISGTSTDLDTGLPVTVQNEEVLIVRGMSGLAAAPISANLKNAIQTSELAATATQGSNSNTSSANLPIAGTAGLLDDTFEIPADANTVPGIPEASAAVQASEGETLLFLHKSTLDQMEAALAPPVPPKVKGKTLTGGVTGTTGTVSTGTTSKAPGGVVGGSTGTIGGGGSGDGGGTTVVYSSGCHDEDWTWSKGFHPTGSVDKNQGTESGSFTGNLHFTAGYELYADAIVRLRKKRGSIAGVCFTYGFSFKNIELGALLVANAGLEANGQFHKVWKPSWQIAKPNLFDHLFFIGPVPVVIGMNMPITAGVEVDAQANLNLELGVNGWGATTIICTTSGCTRYTASYLDVDDLTSPNVTLSGKAKVKPWIQIAGRAYLYDDAVAYAQAGVRPWAEANLWAHAGQSCGDVNQDGNQDNVSALTLSLDVGADITAEVNLLDWVEDSWSWEVWRQPVGFWSFGPGTAVDPMAWTSDPAAPQGPEDWVICDESFGPCGGYTKLIHFRMRPCWPYSSPITYAVNWGGGGVTHHTAAPGQEIVLSPSYQTTGTKTVTITAEHDAVGREIGESTTLTFQVGNTPNPPVFQLPGGGVFAP